MKKRSARFSAALAAVLLFVGLMTGCASKPDGVSQEVWDKCLKVEKSKAKAKGYPNPTTRADEVCRQRYREKDPYKV